ncbi:class I SAM-dependent RNA methyltransferase [Candidatus Bathyarchaeota archaeon]|nr:class I SAM-dependent RNA methyltransferase [Candidatus Bathyarchaeota archaeon]
MEKLDFFATTMAGIEDIAAHEVEELLGCKATPDIGKVFYKSDLNSVYVLNVAARTLNKVMLNLCRSRFGSLDDIYRLSREIDYGWIIDPNQSFAVRSERVGFHDFTSIDVSRVVGQAVIDSYLETSKVRLKVDLDSPDVEIHCLVRDNEFLMGINLTGESLHKRGYRVYEHPAAIKPTLAAAMLLLSGWKGKGSLIDPMCGGATIPIEAAYIARNIAPNRSRRSYNFLKLKLFSPSEFMRLRERILEERREKPEVYGMEKYKIHLEGGIRNAEEAGVLKDIRFKLGDATIATDYPEDRFDFFVVNPPYGIRMTPKKIKLERLYELFLSALKEVSDNSILVLITAAKRKFRKALEKADLEILGCRNVLYGHLNTTIFKCRI